MNLLLFFQMTDEELSIAQQNADWGWTADLVLPALIFVGVVAAVAVLFSLFNMLKNPASMKQFGIGVVVLGILAAIGYSMSPGEVPAALEGIASSNTYKLVGTGILMTGILIGFGLLILVVDMIRGIFKI